MRHVVAILFPALVLSALVGSDPAAAGIILVPGPYNGTTQINQVAPMGELFTAVDPIIQSVGFSVLDFNPTGGPNDLSLTISLYADGLNTLLASGTVDLTPGFDGFADVTFTQPVGPLLVGTPYTAIITDTTTRWGVHTTDGPEVYRDGAPVFQGVVASGSADLALRVVGEAVPLPSAFSMAATGGFCLLLLARPIRCLARR